MKHYKRGKNTYTLLRDFKSPTGTGKYYTYYELEDHKSGKTIIVGSKIFKEFEEVK